MRLILLVFLIAAGSGAVTAATFMVTKTADTNDGVCNADCSLREAIAAANTVLTNDVVEFDAGVFGTSQNINLTMGEIALGNAAGTSGSLTVNGPGADMLRISIPVDARHFNLLGNAIVTINRITIYGRRGLGFGGGFFVFFATLTLNEAVLVNNSAQHGGGIENRNGTVRINNSSISGNSTSAGGGGILNSGNLVEVTNSTISYNSATDSGGGIYNINGGSVNLTSVTVSNNTVSNNVGGGVNNTPGAGAVTVHNSIIADNTSPTAPDFSGNLASNGYNLIENIGGTNITGITAGNILGLDPQLSSRPNSGDPVVTRRLLPTSPAIDAADPTNFPGADQRGVLRPQDGDRNGSALPDIGAYERQVNVFTVTKTEDTNDALCDADCSFREAIAASTIAATPDNAIVFDEPVFSSPQTIVLTGIGLAIPDNNRTLTIEGSGRNLLTVSGNNQIPILFNQSEVLIRDLKIINSRPNTGQSPIRNNRWMTIINCNFIGNSSATGGGAISNLGTMTIRNSLISGNAANGTSSGFDGGGGVENDSGILTIIESEIINNSAAAKGGGIRTESGGSVTILNSTIAGNTAFSGGGIYNSSGGFTATLNITNSTISGNVARSDGGAGIHSFSLSSVNLNHVTITRNIAATDAFGTGTGGGVRNQGSGFFSRNSLIADNSDNGNAPDFSGTLSSQGYNLIENANGITINGSTTGNIIGQDPLIDPILRSNGGPTRTHALKVNSPAIDKGGAANPAIAVDQRGLLRPFDFSSIPNAPGGNASDIGAFERQANDVNPPATAFDFDGDGKTDLSIFRPGPGEWWYNRSSNGGNTAFQFGAGTDTIAPADFTGDGKTDVAFFRPSTGQWFVLRSEDLSFYAFPFGTNGDVPVPADYDADGKADAAVFRPSTLTWFIQKSGGGTDIIGFGAAGDVPTVADYDGDGKADIAIYRPNGSSGAGEWWVKRSSNASVFALQFGTPTDKTVQGDYTGDGKADIAFWRPSTGGWFVLRSEDFSFFSFPFGTNGDIPVPGDYDGDGRNDAAVFRPSSSTWFAQRSTAGTLIQQFGITGDIPLPSAYVR